MPGTHVGLLHFEQLWDSVYSLVTAACFRHARHQHVLLSFRSTKLSRDFLQLRHWLTLIAVAAEMLPDTHCICITKITFKLSTVLGSIARCTATCSIDFILW